MKRLLVAVAGLTILAAPAVAQDVVRPIRFGVQGGVSMPMGDLGDAADMGFIVGGLADWKPATLPIGIRFNVDYQRWGSKVLDGESLSSISGTAAAMYAIPTTGGISPYVLGGLGMYRSTCSVDDCPSETDLGFNVGGGLNFNLGALDTFLELRYHSVDDATFVPIAFGIRF